MASRPKVVCVAAAAVLSGAAVATAEPYQVGGFFGPRFFSDDAEIGAKPDYRTTLQTSFTIGPRVSKPMLAWLVPEAELPLSVVRTVDLDVSVLWVEPRAHVRFEWPRGERARPFALLGGGVPMTASTKRGIFGSDVSWEAYGGFGGMFSPGRALSFRLDLRVGITDGFQGPTGAGSPIAVEVEATIGMFIELEGGKPRRRSSAAERAAKVADRDGDHIPDHADRCPDQAEDEDGHEDDDGCPDIDDDLDGVLDIADACPRVPETYNGFEDDDGCPDTVPGELRTIVGTIEGLLYPPGGTEVSAKAGKPLDAIAAVLETYPSVRIVLVAHTDDREAEVEADDDDADDVVQLLADALEGLARRRGAAVREALVDRGVGRGRIDVDGRGAVEPVSDNDDKRGRLRNRRVEVRLFVPNR
jgi:outer membrane protein OmpA-like peptidoglycan-associated protein